MATIMIDTVKLELTKTQYKITNPNNFGITNDDYKYYKTGLKPYRFKKFPYNAKKSDKYFPRLTLIYRWNSHKKEREFNLTIEFSCPKLLYGNNIDELSENQFSEVIHTLQKKIFAMGVNVDRDTLVKSKVIIVHYGKNIQVNSNTNKILETINKSNVTKHLHKTTKLFKNDGHALYFDNGSWQIVFYDKIKDYYKNKRASVDKEQLQYHQLPLFKGNKINLLRFEVRLTNRKKITNFFSKIGYEQTEVHFKDVFNESVSMKILNLVWDKYILENNPLIYSQTPLDIVHILTVSSEITKKTYRLQKLLALAYLNYHMNQFGIRNLKNILSSYYTETHIDSYIDASIKEINRIQSQELTHQPFVYKISRSLYSYEPIKLSDVISSDESG